MILFLLGLFDVILSLLVLLNIHESITYFLILCLLFKGLWSIITSGAQKFYFDIFGWIDLATSVTFLFDMNFTWIAIFLFIKGIFSMISDI